MAIRLDAAVVRLGATPSEVRPGGYKVYTGVATFGDVVLDYPEFGWSEFVPASVALDAETVRMTEGIPFTVVHPDDLLDAADEDSIREHTEGFVLRARARPDAVPPEMVVDVVVHTASAQDAIESGAIRELSLGYESTSEDRAGAHGGKPYQKVQTKRRPNHLSAVRTARSTAPDGRRARLDSSGASYAHPGETMEDDLTPATTDDSRRDAEVVVTEPLGGGDPLAMLAGTFSPEAIEILKTLPEADMAALTGLVVTGKGEAAEQAVIAAAGGADPDVEVEEAEDATAPMAARGLTAGAGLTKDEVQQMIDAAVAKVAGGKMDSPAPAPAARPTVRPTPTPAVIRTRADESPRIDAADVARRAAEIVDADQAFVAHVRQCGHRCDSVRDASTQAMAVIRASAPKLTTAAERALKENRRDDFVALFDAAEDLRRHDLMGDQFLVLDAAQHGIAADRLGTPPNFQGLTVPGRALAGD